MKKANKAVLGVVALLTAFSVCTFTACAEKPAEEGAIAGDYKEATSQDVNDAITKIQGDNLAGDTTSENYKFGLAVDTELKAEANLGAYGSGSGSVKYDYKVLADKDKVTGAGSTTIGVNVNVPQEGGKTQNTKVDITGKFYNDAQYMYMDITPDLHDENNKVNPVKGKVDYMELYSAIGGLPLSLYAADAQAPAQPDVLEILTEYGVTTYVDNTDGVKLKLSASQETVWALLAETGTVPEAQITTIKEAVTFNAFQLDAYLAVDKAGVFSAASVVINLDVKVDMSKLMPAAPQAAAAESAPSQIYTAKVSGHVKVSAYTGEAPTLPEGIATDTTYLDMTEDAKKGLGGIL